MKKNGYTFAEMLVVVAIIALMMVIMIPRLAFQQRGAGLKGAATEVMSALRAARRLAITNRELRALALDIYSIPAEFVVMRPRKTGDPGTLPWIEEGERRQLPDNIAIVAIIDNAGDTSLDATRTDDVDLDADDEDPGTPGQPELPTDAFIFNPELDPVSGNPGRNGIVNPIYRLIKFNPTGTADTAIIYLWNITEGRLEFPAPSPAISLSNFHALGVPPGLSPNPSSQQQFFTVSNPASTADSYYYTVVVNPITGGVMVYDYAWGDGEWDRKKDGG